MGFAVSSAPRGIISVTQRLVAPRKAVQKGICILAGRLREAFETLAAGGEVHWAFFALAQCRSVPSASLDRKNYERKGDKSTGHDQPEDTRQILCYSRVSKKTCADAAFCARNCVAYHHEVGKCTLYRGAAQRKLINADEPSLLRGAQMST